MAKLGKKKELNYQSVESLQPVVNVVNDAAMALNDKTRPYFVRRMRN